VELNQYQNRAQATDRVPLTGEEARDREARLVPLLGLAGEVGTLLAGYKKFLRDGEAYELFTENVGEEVGDLLWYLANVAEKWGLSLDKLAAANLKKTTERWPAPGARLPRRKPTDLFDHKADRTERLPRNFTVDILPVGRDRGPEERIEVRYRGKPVGSRLGDNTYDASGYRFHDIFHLSNAAILGWSPVSRAQLFDCKRREQEIIGEVEDGGRAIVIEEGMAAFLFEHARHHHWFEEVNSLDYNILKTIRVMTADLEVRNRPLWEVEKAVLQGFAVWRQVRDANGGRVIGDLYRRSIEFQPLP
jgi:NTP pyrophosphatase (non-canonical NTP hydrolase)